MRALDSFAIKEAKKAGESHTGVGECGVVNTRLSAHEEDPVILIAKGVPASGESSPVATHVVRTRVPQKGVEAMDQNLQVTGTQGSALRYLVRSGRDLTLKDSSLVAETIPVIRVKVKDDHLEDVLLRGNRVSGRAHGPHNPVVTDGHSDWGQDSLKQRTHDVSKTHPLRKDSLAKAIPLAISIITSIRGRVRVIVPLVLAQRHSMTRRTIEGDRTMEHEAPAQRPTDHRGENVAR